jgi:hypothetical protein
MAESVVEICNAALTFIGDSRITSLTDNSPEARACNARYANVRDAVLYSHPWNGAIQRVSLASETDTPVFAWSYQMTLPTDPWCLRVLELENTDHDQWAIEGRKLLCDLSSVNIRYIKRITDTMEFSPELSETMSMRLAHSISYSLTGSRQMQNDLWAMYEQMLRSARSIDGLEGKPPDIISEHFIDARL